MLIENAQCTDSNEANTQHRSVVYEDRAFTCPSTGTSHTRLNDGLLYVVATYMHYDYTINKRVFQILLFKTDNPFDSSKWSIPIEIANPQGTIDPDLLWDNDNGTMYLASGWGSIYLAELNLETGSASTPAKIWSGSGGSNPEGPHFFRKDDYFYLLVAEGGIGPNHSETIARSRDLSYGPYKSYKGNPIFTNRRMDEFFQTVRYADFFPGCAGGVVGCCTCYAEGAGFAQGANGP
ncbi:glycosyl hydrolase [Aspergillus insuetus]